MISLKEVKRAADWGQRRVLFLPNLERLTSQQAIALDEWISNGGLVITSGPIGNLSSSGTRQLVRSIMGGYWKDTFQNRQQLQPTKAYQELTNYNKLWAWMLYPILTSRSVAATQLRYNRS